MGNLRFLNILFLNSTHSCEGLQLLNTLVIVHSMGNFSNSLSNLIKRALRSRHHLL